MAPNLEGNGLTNALKQVYYIHKSIVADLMSKNQILEEECKKLKSLKKGSTSSSAESCLSCRHLEQMKRRLQKALQSTSHTVCSSTEKGSRPREKQSKTNSRAQTRLCDELFADSGTAEHEDMKQMDSSKKRKSVAPENNLDPSCRTENPKATGLHLLEKSTELNITGVHNSTVLAPETEVINTAWQAPEILQRDKTSECAFDMPLELADEAQNSKIYMIPETLNIEAMLGKDGEGSGEEEFFDDEPNDKDIILNEGNKDPDSLQPEAAKLSLQMKKSCGPVGTTMQNKIAGKELNEEVQNKTCTLKSNATQKYNSISEQNSSSEVKSVPSTESHLKQTTLNQVLPKGTSSNNPDTEQLLNAKASVANKQTVGEIRQFLRDSKGKSVLSLTELERKGNTNAGSFQVPSSSAQKFPSKSKSNPHSSKNMNREKSQHSLPESGKQINHFTPVSKSSSSSTLEPKENAVSRHPDYLESQGEKDTFDQPPTLPQSMDETIAPNQLGQQQLATHSESFVSPNPQNTSVFTLVEDEADLSNHEIGKTKQTSAVKPLRGPKSTSSLQQGLGNNKSPGNRKSLKLNKSKNGETERSLPSRLTVREIANSKSHQRESFYPGQQINSKDNPLAGMFNDSDADLSDDSDLDQVLDNETIAPSPQSDSVRSQGVPCSSTSYKFRRSKTYTYGDTSSKRLLGSSLQEEGVGNDASHPIQLEDDDDVLDIGHGNMTSTLNETCKSTRDQQSQNEDKMPEEPNVDQGNSEMLPYHQQESLDELENSFDRVPRNEVSDIPHVEVVRKRSERDKLEGFSCKQCHEYYKNSGLSEEELKKKMKECSRHKERYKRPDTPEHFWTLGFPDTAEIMDRQKKSQHAGGSPVTAKKRPRRKKQLQRKF